jgi:hypothetical protein
MYGDCYITGNGVVQDEEKRLVLARESAAAGSCFGQYVVGWCYDGNDGNGGILEDKAEAVRLCSLAAAQGDANAQVRLGVTYDVGDEVAQDHIEALRLYRLAAEQGMQTLRSFWATYFSMVEVLRRTQQFTAEMLRRTMPRLCDSGAG